METLTGVLLVKMGRPFSEPLTESGGDPEYISEPNDERYHDPPSTKTPRL